MRGLRYGLKSLVVVTGLVAITCSYVNREGQIHEKIRQDLGVTNFEIVDFDRPRAILLIRLKHERFRLAVAHQSRRSGKWHIPVVTGSHPQHTPRPTVYQEDFDTAPSHDQVLEFGVCYGFYEE